MAETITVNDAIGSKLVNLDDLKVAFDSLQTQLDYSGLSRIWIGTTSEFTALKDKKDTWMYIVKNADNDNASSNIYVGSTLLTGAGSVVSMNSSDYQTLKSNNEVNTNALYVLSTDGGAYYGTNEIVPPINSYAQQKLKNVIINQNELGSDYSSDITQNKLIGDEYSVRIVNAQGQSYTDNRLGSNPIGISIGVRCHSTDAIHLFYNAYNNDLYLGGRSPANVVHDWDKIVKESYLKSYAESYFGDKIIAGNIVFNESGDNKVDANSKKDFDISVNADSINSNDYLFIGQVNNRNIITTLWGKGNTEDGYNVEVTLYNPTSSGLAYGTLKYVGIKVK